MLFYNEELRLLLKICILLLKANRQEIDAKELNTISLKEFKIENVVEKLISHHLADVFKSVIKLLYPQEFYEEMVREMDYNEIVFNTYRKENRKFDEKSLYYKTAIIYKEITENKYNYMNLKIRNKFICGIGPRAIVLKENKDDRPEFHNFFNDISLSADNSTPDGLELAQEIIEEYGDKNDFHIKYALI